MPVQEDRQDECKEEQDCVHDPQGPRCLQQGAVLVQIEGERRSAASAIVSKGTQIDVDGSGGEAGTVGVTDASQHIVRCDEGADKAEVDECDKQGRAPGRAEAEEGHDGPCAGEDGNDEEDEDEGWGELVVLIEAMDEICLDALSIAVQPGVKGRRQTHQHANDGNQSHNFNNSPEGEE